MFYNGGRHLRPSKEFQANILYILVSGHPRKSEYSGFINDRKPSRHTTSHDIVSTLKRRRVSTGKCKLWREKLEEKFSDFKLKEKIRKRKWRVNIRKEHKKQKNKKYKEVDKLRKWGTKKTKQANTQMKTPQPNGKSSSATNNSTPNSSLLFSYNQTLYRNIARAYLH